MASRREGEPQFRRIWRASSLVFGVGMLANAATRVAMIYALPVDLVPALGGALYAASSVALLVVVNIYQARLGFWSMLLGASHHPQHADDPASANASARRRRTGGGVSARNPAARSLGNTRGKVKDVPILESVSDWKQTEQGARHASHKNPETPGGPPG